jgi:hypothetical protein
MERSTSPYRNKRHRCDGRNCAVICVAPSQLDIAGLGILIRVARRVPRLWSELSIGNPLDE